MFGMTLDIGGITLVAGVLWMYMQFQLLTDLAEIAKVYNCSVRKRLLQLRTVMTLVGTAGALPVNWEGRHVYAYVMMAVFLIAALWLFRVLFALSGELYSVKTLSQTIGDTEE